MRRHKGGRVQVQECKRAQKSEDERQGWEGVKAGRHKVG